MTPHDRLADVLQYCADNQNTFVEISRQKERNKYFNHREYHLDYQRSYRHRFKKEVESYKQRSAKQRNNSSRLFAKRNGQSWQPWEIDVLMCEDGKSIYQKAIQLQRTYHSVKSKAIEVRRYRKDNS